MKTSIIMMRDLNGVSVRQNHKTWFFNANDLLDLYNSQNKGRYKKELGWYFRGKQFKEYHKEVLREEFLNKENLPYLESGLELIETKRGKYWWTWMHPYIFLDFAMWLSPKFKLHCVKWIFDNLIQFRDECGDWFKEVNKALFDNMGKVSPFIYSNEAKMINKIVFWDPKAGQRKQATEEELYLLKKIQQADTKLIKKGYSFNERFIKLLELKEFL